MMLIRYTFILTLLVFSSFSYSEIRGEFYNQSVLLHDEENLINQGFLKGYDQYEKLNTYLGFAYDLDQRTGREEVYTDQQISPLLGIESKVYFYSKAFLEYRDVHRQGEFADKRAMKTNDLRFGFLGYNKITGKNFFHELYYAAFFSSLYESKVLTQAWYKIGRELSDFDFFNEVFMDSQDFSNDEKLAFDLRPGLRYNLKKSLLNIQFLIQYFIPLTKSERGNEVRSTIVLYSSF